MVISNRLSFVRSAVLCAGMFATVCAAQDNEANVCVEQQEENNTVRYGGLANHELAIFAAGQAIQQDIVDMLEEYIRLEVAAGRPRGEVLCEIHDAFKRACDQPFSTTEKIIIGGVGLVAFVGVYFLTKFAHEFFCSPAPVSSESDKDNGSGSDSDDADSVASYHDKQKSDTFTNEEELDLK